MEDNIDIAEAICFYCHSKDIDCDCSNDGKKALDSMYEFDMYSLNF